MFYLWDVETVTLGIPLAVHVVALAAATWTARVHPARVVLGGAVGLAPLWWLVGFALFGTTCGMTTGGGC